MKNQDVIWHYRTRIFALRSSSEKNQKKKKNNEQILNHFGSGTTTSTERDTEYFLCNRPLTTRTEYCLAHHESTRPTTHTPQQAVTK